MWYVEWLANGVTSVIEIGTVDDVVVRKSNFVSSRLLDRRGMTRRREVDTG